MLNAFTLNNGHLERLTFEVTDDLASSAIVWIDLYAASEAEVAQVERSFDLRLPSPEHLRDIEASARFYEHEGKLHLRSDYLSGTESHAHSVAVAFVLAGETLISIHDEDLPIFRLLRIRLHAESGPIENSRDVLIDLYGMDVEFSADALEEVYADLGRVSQSVLNETLSDKQARDSL
ncbi:MAG: CorA family divalent cation transporter, partial [Sideroxydans sp.]|nr:CorA family divalent cation transporter [Sideroxydans sp.]